MLKPHSTAHLASAKMTCQTLTSKAFLYFVAVLTLLLGLACGLNVLVYGSPHVVISLLSTAIHLGLGVLLLVGLIKKQHKLIETFVFITSCLLVIATLALVLFSVTRVYDADRQEIVIGVVAVRWVVQFVIMWACAELKGENVPQRLVEEPMTEKPVLKV